MPVATRYGVPVRILPGNNRIIYIEQPPASPPAESSLRIASRPVPSLIMHAAQRSTGINSPLSGENSESVPSPLSEDHTSEDRSSSDLQEPDSLDADVGNNLDVASEVAVESQSQNASPENTLESSEGEPVLSVQEEEVVQTVNICVGELKAAFPAKISHFAEIDEKIYAHVKYEKYYERPEMLELHGVYEKVTQRDLTAEIGENVRKLNVAKRGSRVWACPYCRSFFRQGDKYGITRHMNARNDKDGYRQPGCPIRRAQEKKVKGSWPPAKLKPVLISNWS